jgi:hypothetical protein
VLGCALACHLACTYTPIPPAPRGPGGARDAAAREAPARDGAMERGPAGEPQSQLPPPADTRPEDAAPAPSDLARDLAPVPDARLDCAPGQRMACYGGPAGTADVGACRSGERSCAPDGTWSPICVGEQRPAAEACNGLDDDCDGVADDGCPVAGALLRTAQRRPPSPVFGTFTLSGAVAFTHLCPEGQAVVAFTGNHGSGIDALGVRCGRLQIREDRSVQPYRYDVQVTPGQEIAPRGGTGGQAGGVQERLSCPAGQVVVGLSAWLDPDAPEVCPASYCPFTGILCPSVYGLTVSCAAHDLTGAPGNFRLVRRSAPRPAGPRIGVVGGVGEVENPYACPGSGMMQEMKGAYGIWPLDCVVTTINGLQVTCNDPVIPVIPPP